MKSEEVRRVVEAEFDGLVQELVLGDWAISWEVAGLVGSTRGDCTITPSQAMARIRLDADKLEDVEDVCQTLRHELLHVVLGNLDTYQYAVEECLTEGEQKATSHFMECAVEKTVRHLERILTRRDGC